MTKTSIKPFKPLQRRVLLIPASLLASGGILLLGAALGSSSVGFANPGVVRDLRLPRVILAFLTGGSLAVSGAVFQSVLKNQLASPYILGVSSGASLGAALVMMGSIAAVAGSFTLPLAGFVFGLGTVFLVIILASALDRSLSNHTIILFGMVSSLFVNAILTVISSLFRRELRNLIIWQMGSFALRGWTYVRLLIPFLVVGLLGILRYIRELDILSFGEEEALSMGVNTRPVRKRLFFFAALLTGASVALSGAIGFVDLVAPHAARRIAGSAHRWVIFLSFCAGGILMVAADLLARLIISPSELPVGAVTALIGAPFFIWVYFRKN
ncbi:MAG: iron ABC transporter permease [Spirochaetaceae bacterium]|jgi:iron complex transport system permease protein|nr:iron ABC transporter permease [Spirochaetaceae bacterium]